MRRRVALILLGLLLLASFAAYLPSIDGDFVLDDFELLRDPLVVAPGTQDASAWLRSPRPLLAATFALNHAAGGLATRAWHVTNVLVHLGAVVLAWRLARRLLDRAGLARPDGAALSAAALFALHPLQTESVSYLTQRAESLAAGLYLAALLVLLARDEAPSAARRAALLAWACALHAAALLVKPVAATLPAAWLLAAALVPAAAEREAGPWRRVLGRLPAAAPLLALSLAAALRGLAATAGANDAGFGLPDLPAGRYLATQLRVIPRYLGLVVWPANQCADCSVAVSPSPFDPASLAGAAFLAAALAGSLWVARRAGSARGDGAAAMRLVAFGYLFFLLVLSPSSSVIPLRDPLAEHRIYLAVLGPFVGSAAAAAALLRRLFPSRSGAVGAAVALALLAGAAAVTARRNLVWSSRLAFYREAARTAPDKARAHHNLGAALVEVERFEEAVASFRRAAQLEEDRTVSPRLIFENLVAALVASRRLGEARREVLDVLLAEPDDPWALAMLAEVELSSGRPAEAEAAALAALRGSPGNPKALKYLGLARLRGGDPAGAAPPLRAAAAASSIDPALLNALGEAEAALGNHGAACRAYARGAEVPSSPGQLARSRAALARLGCGGDER